MSINLPEYQQSLTTQRDNALAEGRSDRAGAFMLALELLHTWTDGEFGTPLHGQPNPYAERADDEAADYWAPEPIGHPAVAEWARRQPEIRGGKGARQDDRP